MTERATYLDLAERLRTDPPKTPEAVEDRLGIGLRPASRKARVADEGAGTGADGLAFAKVRLRYLPTGEPSVLVLTLPEGTGPSREEVLERFEGLRLIAAPTGRSEEEEAEYGRNEPWGLLAFGFPEKDPERLRTIIFNYLRKK